MDDVIFSGTANRPSRNIADVALHVSIPHNGQHSDFASDESIEISRRLERDVGSFYRINGRDVRARDIHLLFADASTGARSPALVRQGQISELIGAKPAARRRILEEAAGVTGLHARRHEAELKLGGAESNLSRLEDILAQQHTQLASLKKQSRQAQRYKDLSAEIRKLEAGLLYRAWLETQESVRREETILCNIMAQLSDATLNKSTAELAYDESTAALQMLRSGVAAKKTGAMRLRVQIAELAGKEQQLNNQNQDLNTQIRQILLDFEREQQILSDGHQILIRLNGDEENLSDLSSSDEKMMGAATAAFTEASELLSKLQDDSDHSYAVYTRCISNRSAAENSLLELQSRLSLLESEYNDALTKLQLLSGPSEQEQQLQSLMKSASQLAKEAESHERIIAEIEEESLLANHEEAVVRDKQEQARRRADTLLAEARTLGKILAVPNRELWPPILDKLDVDPGYERALAAALGDSLDATSDEAAPVHWARLPPLGVMPPLPANAVPMAAHVRATESLQRSLGAIGIVQPGDGPVLQRSLRPGQCLVSQNGDLWRWDGFTVTSGANSAAAIRLAERNRLSELNQQAKDAERAAIEMRAAFGRVRAHLDELRAHEHNQRDKLRSVHEKRESIWSQIVALERRAVERRTKQDALAQAVARLDAELSHVISSVNTTSLQLESMEPLDTLRDEVSRTRLALTHQRDVHAKARTYLESLENEIRFRRDRLNAVRRDQMEWHERTRRAVSQIENLQMRLANARTKLADLATLPSLIETQRIGAENALIDADNECLRTENELAEVERSFTEAERQLRLFTEALSGIREQQARQTEHLSGLHLRLAECRDRIMASLGTDPAGALRAANMPTLLELPIQKLAKDIGKLKDARDQLGAVNLRAAEESERVGAEIQSLTAEREDIIAAIQKLRLAISSLNAEARQRLLNSFSAVKTNFSYLFQRLFEGGNAELKLTESEDPLEAGLEIVAHPPGKRPQLLSLLSGGEQALTAISLIFAVFLTSPTPICVLDEVDASLDDANVGRFCTLLDVMLSRVDTRFLVVTHHPVTMSRMHRLYGVTMIERGVSQLVSVNLETSPALRQAG